MMNSTFRWRKTLVTLLIRSLTSMLLLLDKKSCIFPTSPAS